MRALGACGLVLAILFALQLLVRRAPWGVAAMLQRRAGALRLLDSIFLPERASLHVIEIEGRRLLIGRAHGAVSLLCDLDPARTSDRSIASK